MPAFSWLDQALMPEPTPPLDAPTTGTVNDLAATDVGANLVSAVRFTGAGAVTLTGLVCGVSYGRRIHLMAVGGALTLANSSASSLAQNRIVTGTGADLVVAQGAAVFLVYDLVASVWRVSGGSGGGGGSTPTGTGLRKVVSGVEAGAASLLVNADVASGAAIASSKIAPPGSTGQVIWNSAGAFSGTSGITTDGTWFAFGTTPATTGTIRLPYAATDVVINSKDSVGTNREVLSRIGADFWQLGANTASAQNWQWNANALSVVFSNYCVITSTSGTYALSATSGSVFIGCSSSFTGNVNSVKMYPGTDVSLGLGSTTYLQLLSAGLYCNVAAKLSGGLGGDETTANKPFKWTAVTIASANGTITMTQAQYSCRNISFSTGASANFTVNGAPAQAGVEYSVSNESGFQVTFMGVPIATGITTVVVYSPVISAWRKVS